MTLRSLNWFAYRYWWLILLLFFGLVFLFLWFCVCGCYSEPGCCDKEKILHQRINSIENSLDSCCGFAANTLKPCDYAGSISGGPGLYEMNHNLGNRAGTVRIRYNMYDLMDEMQVYYDNRLVCSTNGLVAGTGMLEWDYKPEPGKPDYCKVRITAPRAGTEWYYYINCPQ